MAALATISSGLSLRQAIRAAVRGSNAGHSSSAPLGLLMAAPVLALLMLLRLPGTPPQPTPERKSVSLKRDVCLICFAQYTGCGGEHDAAWTFACPYSPVRHGYHRH